MIAVSRDSTDFPPDRVSKPVGLRVGCMAHQSDYGNGARCTDGPLNIGARGAQEVVLTPATVENPHMHVYGSNDLANCFMHFDGNDTSGSAQSGRRSGLVKRQN